jgi:proline iminopeptidase
MRNFYGACLIWLFCFSAQAQGKLTPSEGMYSLNGTELFIKIIGKGEPLLLIHGGPGLNHQYFLPSILNLSKQYQLIFYDQRGCGQSSANQDAKSMTISRFVEDIEAIRQYFGIQQLNLLGHSWGGFLAMQYAIKYPQNLKSLLLLNSSSASQEFRQANFKLQLSKESEEVKKEKELIKSSEDFKAKKISAYERFFQVNFKTTLFNPSLSDSLHFGLPSNYLEANKLLYLLFNDLQDYDLHPKLALVKCKVLIVRGDSDGIVKESDEKIRQSFTNAKAELIEMKNCGHFPFLEKPAEFYQIIQDFMKKSE